MSTWTHVVGCIRVDGLPTLGSNIAGIEQKIGPMDLWDKPNGNCKLPTGSEGSLEYKIIKYSNGLPWLSIPIWGDLRSYENFDEIREWFTALLKELVGIRDAVLAVDCREQHRVLLWEVDEDGNGKVSVR